MSNSGLRRLAEAAICWLWACYYRAFPVLPPPGKGLTRDDPLEWEDVEPLMTALRRMGYNGDEQTPSDTIRGAVRGKTTPSDPDSSTK